MITSEDKEADYLRVATDWLPCFVCAKWLDCVDFAEYATVGYVEKRIRLRKTQYQMMQKLVESRKKTVTVALEAEMEHAPRQTVRQSLIDT